MKTLNYFILAVLLLIGRPALAGDPAAPSGNIFLSAPQLPATLKRVVVLPLTCNVISGDLYNGCQTLDPVLKAALIKTGRFEMVSITPDQLRNCTGQLSWMGDEVLPSNFFGSLKNYNGCDGVMFCQLTTLRSNAPLAIGWRLKLVDATTGKILWSADEVFDAGNMEVAKDAEAFEKSQQPHHNVAYGAYAFVLWLIHVPAYTAQDDQWEHPTFDPIFWPIFGPKTGRNPAFEVRAKPKVTTAIADNKSNGLNATIVRQNIKYYGS